jgi:hypothetical protein
MAIIGTDFPDRLARAGLVVHVLEGWESRGDTANHKAVVLHHTASSSSESPSSCANYSLVANEHYNVICDRNGEVWVGNRNESDSSGKISSVALNEAHRGQAGHVSAVDRGLGDDTSSNSTLFAVSAQNNGVGEHWSDQLVHAIYVTAAVALEALGIPDAGYTTQHRVLTARKIDNCGDACPYDFQPGIRNELDGDGPDPPKGEPDMWTLEGQCPAGDSRSDYGVLQIALPAGRKSARVQLYVDCEPDDGVSLWACANLKGKNHGLWSGGNTWELWVPGRNPQAVDVTGSAYAVSFHHMGGTKAPLLVSISGT